VLMAYRPDKRDRMRREPGDISADQFHPGDQL
jgi:hypothetical protein